MTGSRHLQGGDGARLLLGLLAALGLLVGTLLVAAYRPRLARTLPGTAAALEAAAGLLPRTVAWANDRGGARLRAGVYLGWTDGERGELHLYGEGCSAEEGPGALTYLALTGPGGTVEVPPRGVTQQWVELEVARAHPILRLEVSAGSSLEFDRAVLRCRSGAEESVRIAATLLHLPAPPPGPEHPLTSLGVASFPGIGLVGEVTLVSTAVASALEVTALDYAPTAASAARLRGAAGLPAQSALWRSLARDPAHRAPHLPDPAALTPWDAAYQSPHDPRRLRLRAAQALALPLAAGEWGMLFLDESSFRRTVRPLPILVQPVVRYTVGAEALALPVDGIAFGWTEAP